MAQGQEQTIEIEVGYMTGTGNTMKIAMLGHLMDRRDVPLLDINLLAELCGDCRGKNGGCYPYAPGFQAIKPALPYFYVLIVRFDMIWAIKYAGKADSGKRSGFFRSSYADRLTDLYLWRILRRVESAEGTYGVGCGNCPGCSTTANCDVLRDECCQFPDRRRFSMEATGVDCSALHQHIFDDWLAYWYYTAESPQYMYRYAGVFSKGHLDSELLDAIVVDDHYIHANLVPEPPSCPVVTLEAPEGTHDEGKLYSAYMPD